MDPVEPSRAESRPEGRSWTIAAFVMAALAFFVAPIIAGPIGAVLGWVGYRKGDRYGLWAMWAAIVMALMGLTLAALFVTNGGRAR